MCLAVPGRIVAIASAAPMGRPRDVPPADADLWRMATVDFGGVRQSVSLACLPEARLDDLVLVHVGLAICRVEETLLEPIEESKAPPPRPPAVAASDHGVGQGRPEGGESRSLHAASPDPLSQPSPLPRTVPVRADRWEDKP